MCVERDLGDKGRDVCRWAENVCSMHYDGPQAWETDLTLGNSGRQGVQPGIQRLWPDEVGLLRKRAEQGRGRGSRERQYCVKRGLESGRGGRPDQRQRLARRIDARWRWGKDNLPTHMGSRLFCCCCCHRCCWLTGCCLVWMTRALPDRASGEGGRSLYLLSVRYLRWDQRWVMEACIHRGIARYCAIQIGRHRARMICVRPLCVRNAATV